MVNLKRRLQVRKSELRKNPHRTPETDEDQPDCKVVFDGPYDPPGFPKVAFDFGVSHVDRRYRP